MTKDSTPVTLEPCVPSPQFPEEPFLLLDNEKGSDPYLPAVEGRPAHSGRRRAVLIGEVWSADLAETLMDVYGTLISEGWSLEDLSRMVQESSDDRPGD